ncbi:hypothetical protein PD5205_03449 [Xanthomonas fragariae]|uniref:Uncharacterized protein n=1 Tax=Xanthomonas fragariae TaxID=48664 RepID=A0A1Y6HMI4_9XANT|nr:hypothetical protein PD5205_03449 [Xanthomonas fragariae]
MSATDYTDFTRQDMRRGSHRGACAANGVSADATASSRALETMQRRARCGCLHVRRSGRGTMKIRYQLSTRARVAAAVIDRDPLARLEWDAHQMMPMAWRLGATLHAACCMQAHCATHQTSHSTTATRRPPPCLHTTPLTHVTHQTTTHNAISPDVTARPSRWRGRLRPLPADAACWWHRVFPCARRW